MRALAALFFAASLSARVIVVSLDGLGYETWKNDPLAAELTSLHALARRGVEARGLAPHFPSTTANSHAALFTGAWGDVNGIAGNLTLPTPRHAHTAFDRISGYRSDELRAEPVWVTAGRQGIRTVAVQVTQAYPFSAASVGAAPKVPPVVVNGYQTKLIAPHMMIRANDVRESSCASADAAVRCLEWSAGPITLHGRVDTKERTFAISAAADGPAVTARLRPLESEPPRNRKLARHFSDGLYVDDIPDSTPAVIYFRLFELSEDGSDFLLYQTPVHELGVHHGSADSSGIVRRLLRDAGGFIGNGPGHGLMREPFTMGVPLWKGGDGTAERRYLEACELVTRQVMRHARWFLENYSPELFIGYLNFPDEFEHNWKGARLLDSRYDDLRRWAYVLVNTAADTWIAMSRPEDHILFVSDHGVAAVTHEVAINAALKSAGLLDVQADGRIDGERTRAMHLRNCILLNTEDWKGGIVPAGERKAVLARVTKALKGIREPDTGRRVVTRIYSSKADAERFGFGGPNGADLCFDYLPGYAGSDAVEGPLVKHLPVPIGYHGFDPTRLEMQAIFIAAGPKLPQRQTWPRLPAIDVAPLVTDLLGIDPPKDARGKSPLR